MKKIALDATGCQTPDDFYRILLPALKAPDWHGHNLDALWDGITGGLKGIRPPFMIEVAGMTVDFKVR